MSQSSICFTGLSREEEGQVTTLFKQANARVGNHWLLAPENAAGVLVIDMDSMYGQMSLMKAIGSGQVLVALTASGRAETDYVLRRPVTVDGLVELLSAIAGDAPAAAAQAAPAAPAAPREPDPAPPAPAPVPALAPAPALAAAPAPAEPAPIAAPAADEPAALPADPRLTDLLRPGALPGPVRLQFAGAPDLVLDPASQTYLGASALKPLLPYCSAVFGKDDLVPVAAADLPGIATALGGSQPLSRLAWLCALTGGNGALAAGFGPNERYKLLKWPQTEREFPKHFRIATVMMKGPANLTEIADQSGSTLGEVIDFVNACLAIGVAEPDVPAAPAPDAAKAGGLLGRFRR